MELGFKEGGIIGFCLQAVRLNGKGLLAYDALSGRAFDDLLILEPNNGSRRAALDGQGSREGVFRVVHDSEIVFDANQAAGSIGDTARASRASDFAIGEGLVSFGKALASDP